MKVLVTGATGFVGSVLMPELIARYGASAVSAFVLPGDPLPATWRGSGVRTLAGDISDARAVRTAAAGHSHIVHLAGFISYWKGDEDRLRTVNEDGGRAIVEASLAAGVERLIHISSVGAVGFHESGQPADETAPFNWPADILYMGSKRRGQDIVEQAVRERGLRAVILSPACGRRAYPFPGPAPLLAAAGHMLEQAARRTGRRPLLTAAYGRLSGWTAFYDNAKSCREFDHVYIDVEKTVRDGWDYYRNTFGREEGVKPTFCCKR